MTDRASDERLAGRSGAAASRSPSRPACTEWIAATLEALPDLKIVVCNGAGLDRIDLAEARRRKIAVCHTPDELAEDVGEAPSP